MLLVLRLIMLLCAAKIVPWKVYIEMEKEGAQKNRLPITGGGF